MPPPAMYIFKHREDIGPGWLLDRTADLHQEELLRVVTLKSEEQLPMAFECNGVILVGQSVEPALLAARQPLLRAQLVFIRTLVGLGVPYLGIDRGAQLLARALLGKVHDGRNATLGAGEMALTEAGRADVLFGVESGALPVIRWPTHPITLPPRAVRLGGPSEAPEAFRVGESAWGLLPHVEVTPQGFADWVAEPESTPLLDKAGTSADEVLQAVRASQDRQRDHAYRVMDRFIAQTTGYTHDVPPLQIKDRPHQQG